ncbi:hypothetical protein BDZ89DRAFT_1102004 [Hymenopellis radicata]|nr:hypothetical protein BDZ89DRAFT_1102004 [Hymenopellis radicata]
MNLAMHAATPKIEAFYQHYASQAGDKAMVCGGGSWVDWYGTVACDVETLVQLAGKETIDSQEGIPTPFVRPNIFSFDHVYPSSDKPPSRTAVFYASLHSEHFRELHSYLLTHASSGALEYVFRHIPPGQVRSKNYLTGYGVALDLKKMDYLAVDDRNTNNGGEYVSTEDAVKKVDIVASLIDAHPEATSSADTLTEEEILSIGLKASQIIAEADEPLDALQQLSQNFPKYATALGRRVVVNDSVTEEIHNNQLKVQGGINALWLNGAPIAEKDVTPLGLLRMLKKERAISTSLTALGLSRAEAMELLTSPIIAAAQGDRKGLDGLVDASDRPEGGEVITWWNDFDTDSRYARWNPSLSTLLRPVYPGQFHNVKLNLFNVVLLLDLSQPNALAFVSGAVKNIIDRNFPFRFGVVPSLETEDGAKMARLFYFLLENFGRKKTMIFLRNLSQADAQPRDTVDWKSVRATFEAFLDEEDSEIEDEVFDFVIGGELAQAKAEGIKAYTERLSATMSSSPEGHCFINGKHYDMNENFLRAMQNEVAQQLQHLQEQIYEGALTDDDAKSIATYFYDLPTTQKKRNRYIIPSSTIGGLTIYSLPAVFATSGFDPSPGAFVYPPEGETPISMFVVADFDTEGGLKLLKGALESIDSESKSRVTFIHNPEDLRLELTVKETPVSWLVTHLASQGLISKSSPTQLMSALGMESPTSQPGSQAPISAEGSFQTLAGEAKYDQDRVARYLRAFRLLLKELQIAPGSQAVIVNGRVLGPFDNDFGSGDFKALEYYELSRRVEAVNTAILDIAPALSSLDRASLAQLVSYASSVISSIQLPDPSEAGLFDSPQRPRSRNYAILDKEYTGFHFGDNTTALYQISAVIDPVSETAQRWSSLLKWISTIPDTYVEVRLNPGAASEIQLKRFFRYNLRPTLLFDENGDEIPAEASFEDLPVEPIYTLAMEVPSSWLVRPRVSSYDLDNIQLGQVSSEDASVDAIFELDYIVVEGHARDSATNAPPRGLQIHLLNPDNTTLDDTLVVANLGYFQFKTTPGVFRLDIREGQGRDIFTVESVGNEGWNSPTVEAVGNDITVTSFEGLTIYPRFKRVPGMEGADVLDPRYEGKSGSKGFLTEVMSKLKSLFGVAETAVAAPKTQADINIFTVASGLLYERFASIMILSVMRNTKSTVKFWFIENFLSPSFLEFIPHLAEAYGFQYELVTYKWPSWLRAQKEKQRIIWAYKILFLDVLFPMDLKKVIFVDADQIVRADLQELIDLDLHGAPYGYTPMGDDNTDMEGFRFWKTGYWKDFLKGRPYHISALYVVDLVRFRQGAAGDILRGQYQALSADPNSLANLDQDLPNNLQREVPIYSLHEDWLWCETWCSKDRLHKAKTIDLCQNPLTKEPKLSRARQIPEWEEYDTEISKFTRKLADEGLITSQIAAVDTNVLAGAAQSPPAVVEAEIKEEEEGIKDEL